MSSWKVVFTREGEEDFDNLDGSIQRRILKKILWLKDNFKQITPLPLGGDWQGFFKLRVGGWRIIYEIEDSKKQIVIHRIARRDKVYEK